MTILAMSSDAALASILIGCAVLLVGIPLLSYLAIWKPWRKPPPREMPEGMIDLGRIDDPHDVAAAIRAMVRVNDELARGDHPDITGGAA